MPQAKEQPAQQVCAGAVAKGADGSHARRGWRRQQLLNSHVDPAARGYFKEGVGYRIFPAGGFQNPPCFRGLPLQTAREHPAAEEVIAGGREACATTTDHPDARGGPPRRDLGQRLAEQKIACLLQSRNLPGGGEQRGQAFRRRVARQECFQRAPQPFARGGIQPRQGGIVAGTGPPPGNRERFAGDEGAGRFHDQVERPGADGRVHDEQRAVIRAEQQHAAVEPRAYGIPSGPDAIAPGKHFHAPILAVAGWFCHSVRLALSFEARCASL